MVHVVVTGALVRRGAVLLGHRTADRRWYPDCWDLPGGHVEPGETPQQALVRELREEIGVEAAVDGGPDLRFVDRDAPGGGLDLSAWVIRRWRGAVVNAAVEEHDELRWARAADLPGLRLAHPAWAPFLTAALRAAGEQERGRPTRLRD